jgi:hypothetical protein
MTGTMDQAPLVIPSQLLLATPNQEHRAIKSQQRFLVQLWLDIGGHSSTLFQ